MTSKLTDRLKRLHSTRVRAQGEPGSAAGVYEADDGVEGAQLVAEAAVDEAPPAPVVVQEPVLPAGPVTEQLRRHRELASRSRRAEPQPSRHAAPRGSGSASLGDHLAGLRNAARVLLDAGSVEAAVPLLHEMASLAPTNPFPLAELARYYRATGRPEWAEIYEARLSAASPF